MDFYSSIYIEYNNANGRKKTCFDEILSVIFNMYLISGPKGDTPLHSRKIENFEKFLLGKIMERFLKTSTCLNETLLITVES